MQVQRYVIVKKTGLHKQQASTQANGSFIFGQELLCFCRIRHISNKFPLQSFFEDCYLQIK